MRETSEIKDAKKILEIPISYEERGKKIGREEGKEEGKEEVAQKLLREGVSKKIIMRATELSIEKIEELERRM